MNLGKVIKKLVEEARGKLFQPHFFQWMWGSRVKLKSLKKA